jgi:uncharacterized Fe-S cluster protein YjdI
MKKQYQKDELIVGWDASKYIHAGFCAKGLSGVFKPKQKPWIDLEGATNEEIITPVGKCPSGALSVI